jgi:lycopene cyclase domain-containing protein
MMTYLLLNLVFIAVVCGVIAIVMKPRRVSRAIIITLAVLLVLTMVFDNLIVGLSIVDYNPDKILGIRIGFAPIEDFMYAILAVILVPAVWIKLGAKNAK